MRERVERAGIPSNYGRHPAEVQPSRGKMSAPMWLLQHTDSDTDPSITFRLSPGSIKTIGRSPSVELTLDAALVSRIHCRLEAHDETLEVVDLDSTNGVYVNGERLARAHMIPGDRLKVGRVEFVVGRSA